MHLPSWPIAIQCRSAAGGARGDRDQGGNASSFEGDHRHVMAGSARGVQHQEGESAVPCDEPETHYSSASTSSCRRVARRRMTPRLDERMNSIRYCTSVQASVRSRSICRSALVVLSFDCRR